MVWLLTWPGRASWFSLSLGALFGPVVLSTNRPPRIRQRRRPPQRERPRRTGDRSVLVEPPTPAAWPNESSYSRRSAAAVDVAQVARADATSARGPGRDQQRRPLATPAIRPRTV